MNMNKLNAQEYLSLIGKRLKQNKYKTKNDIIYNDQLFKFVAKRTRFEFIAFFTTFFIVSRFAIPDFLSLNDFSSSA